MLTGTQLKSPVEIQWEVFLKNVRRSGDSRRIAQAEAGFEAYLRTGCCDKCGGAGEQPS